MQNTDIPTKVVLPFANNAGAGFIRPIPVPSQTGGAASFTDGFPPETFEQIGAGGVPPDGEDFNGLFNVITAWNRWQAAGGAVLFDAVFAAAVGGYPLGAEIASSAVPGLTWVSTVNANATDPDGGSPVGWIMQGSNSHTRILTGSGAFTFLDTDFKLGLKLSGASSSVLPASPVLGREIVIQDLLYNFFANNVVISPNSGQNIGGRTGAFTLDQNGQTAAFTFYGSNTWGLST